MPRNHLAENIARRGIELEPETEEVDISGQITSTADPESDPRLQHKEFREQAKDMAGRVFDHLMTLRSQPMSAADQAQWKQAILARLSEATIARIMQIKYDYNLPANQQFEYVLNDIYPDIKKIIDTIRSEQAGAQSSRRTTRAS